METDWFNVTGQDHDIWRIDETYVTYASRGLMWLVRARERQLLIDGGYGLAPLRAQVTLLQRRPTIAVATHTHYDHIGAMWEIEERAVHRAEAHILAHPTQQATQILPFLEGQDIFDIIPPGWRSVYEYCITPAPPTRILEDGEIIDLGDRYLEVWHTPGHSPGSICLWEAATGVLFSGDTLFAGPLYDDIPGASVEALIESHRRLLELPVQTVHPGHFNSFSGKHMKDLIQKYSGEKEGPE